MVDVKETKESFEEYINEIKKIQKRLVKDRDKLKELFIKIEEISASVTDGIEGIGEGLVFFEDALKDMNSCIEKIKE
jgi:hypothetical protein